MRFINYLLLGLIVASCSTGNEPNDAQSVVDNAIEVAGGELYEHCDLEFDFRDYHYRAYRWWGHYSYERMFEQDGREIHDVLTNDGFTRYINGEEANISNSMKARYANSVNAVLYFVLIPQPLNDPPVIKEYLRKVEIEDEFYHKIKVTFEEQEGSDVHNDIFVYWINDESYTVDYFAYRFYEDGGGLRFRKAYNPQFVNGIRFVDYINYKYDDLETPVEELDSLYKEGMLDELSRIEQKNITVEILDEPKEST